MKLCAGGCKVTAALRCACAGGCIWACIGWGGGWGGGVGTLLADVVVVDERCESCRVAVELKAAEME
jgi:hypothetical protein